MHCCLIGDIPNNLLEEDFGEEWNRWLFARLRLLKRRAEWLPRLLTEKHRKQSAERGERRLAYAVADVIYHRSGHARRVEYRLLPQYVRRLKKVKRLRKDVLSAEARLRRATEKAGAWTP